MFSHFFPICCVVLGAIFTVPIEAKTLQIYVLTGQSNSLGAVKGSPASDTLLEQYKSDGSVKFWHNNFNKTSGASIDTKPGTSTSWGQIVPQFSTYNCMGPEYGFASMMERKGWSLSKSTDDVDMGVVKASLDGGGNEHWVKGHNAYNAIIKTVKEACENALLNGYDKVEIMGVMYLQGESNSGAANTNVAGKFTTFLDNLKADVSMAGVDVTKIGEHQAILGEQAKWKTTNKTTSDGDIVGQTNGNESNSGTTRDQQFALASSEDNMGWVPTRDLAKIKTQSDDNLGVHYDGKSQITIGARYAYEAAKLAGHDVGSVRSGDYNAVLSSADAWMNGKTPTDTVAVWDVASSAWESKVSDKAGTNASLYGIKVEDPYVDTVTIRGVAASSTSSPGMDDGHLILGKGGIEIANGKNLSIASVLEISGDQSWKIAGGSNLIIKGNGNNSANKDLTFITGSGNIDILNSSKAENPSGIARVQVNTYTESTADAFTGNWTIGSGVEVTMNGKDSSSAGSGWGSGKIIMQGGSVLAGQEASGNTWNNNIELQNGTSSSFGGASNTAVQNLTLRGEISGSGTLVKTTANTLVLDHANSYTGGTKIENGTLLVNNKEALGKGAVTVTTGATLNLNSLNINNTIQLAGGDVTGWGDQAYVSIASQNSLITQVSGTLTLMDGSGISAGGTLRVTEGNELTCQQFTVALSSSNLVTQFKNSGTAAILMEGGILLFEQGLVLDINLSGLQEIDGNIFSFQLVDKQGGTLSGLNSIEDLSLAPTSSQWQITNYDASTGIVTVSVPEPTSTTMGMLGAVVLLLRRRRGAC